MIGSILLTIGVVAIFAILLRAYRDLEICPECGDRKLSYEDAGMRLDTEYGHMDIVAEYEVCNSCNYEDTNIDVTSVEDFTLPTQ